MLEDYMRKASLKCPGDGKFVSLHEKYVNLFKDPISFKDDGNEDNFGDDDDENGDDDDGNVDEEDVNKGDKDPNGSNPSFGFSKISLEDFGNDRGPTEKDKVVEGNPTEQGTVVEGNQAEECEIMSTPENFTQWLDKNVDLVGEGDRFENVFEAHFGKFIVYGVRLNLETLAPGLWLDANSKSMFDGTLASFDAKWESFSNQVNAQFKGNKGGLTLGGMDLSEHFYVVVFSLTKTTAMTILDNSPGTYDSKYKEVCDLLKKLFARHLKQCGHIRHTQVARVKQTIPKLKWKTKENFHDCGIFTCSIWKLLMFAIKILLHEINVHVGKMLELAKEFDKTYPVEKMAIIVDAFKKNGGTSLIMSESHEIQSESHEIQSESHEIQSESHEIQSESDEIHKESHEIPEESLEIQVESRDIQVESHEIKVKSQEIQMDPEERKSGISRYSKGFQNNHMRFKKNHLRFK
ncbi:ulp1 protease family, C-terminal catalytic domain-containing protein [Tanacetum coccineum]